MPKVGSFHTIPESGRPMFSILPQRKKQTPNRFQGSCEFRTRRKRSKEGTTKKVPGDLDTPSVLGKVYPTVFTSVGAEVVIRHPLERWNVISIH